MNRNQRRIAARARRKVPAERPFLRSVVPGTALYWIPLSGVAGVKDAWPPFDALIKLMAGHPWMFPTGWALTIVLHWLVAGRESERQRRSLDAIRRSRKGRRR